MPNCWGWPWKVLYWYALSLDNAHIMTKYCELWEQGCVCMWASVISLLFSTVISFTKNKCEWNLNNKPKMYVPLSMPLYLSVFLSLAQGFKDTENNCVALTVQWLQPVASSLFLFFSFLSFPFLYLHPPSYLLSPCRTVKVDVYDWDRDGR